MRCVFLEISNTYDKVWHSGLLLKLKTYGVEGQLLALLKDYFHNRKQRVVFNGQMSDWRKINWSTTRGSVRTSFIFDLHKSI